MDDSFKLARQRPHDTYFEQVFKVQPVTLQLLQAFLSADQVAALNLRTLQLSPESFLSDDLRESFSDLVYTCETIQADPVRICILLEHKSRSTGRRIYIQLGNYLRGVQEEDIRQKRPRFTLTIPILFYHGQNPWNPKPLREHYGAVPPALAGYVPHFDILKVNVQAMLDEEIRGMQDAVLLRNIFLAFKHGRENEFIRQHFREVLIFVHENVAEEILLGLFEATFFYLQIVSSFTKHEIMELVETLPPHLEHKVKFTYEHFVEEGIEKGIKMGIEKGVEKGIEKGIEKLLVAFLKKNPDWPDQAVAEYFDIPVSTVKNVRLVLLGSA
ncbi:MAG: Rpn family recombination-promoting nuclease/putative transposase [Saprospiraceae bacterium]